MSPGAGEHSAHKLQVELMMSSEVVVEEVITSATPLEPLIPPAPLDGRVFKAKGHKLTSYAFTADKEEIPFLDPP